MAYSVFLIAICVINFQYTAGTICYSCASPSLRDKWEVTGLPNPPQNDSMFAAEDCAYPKNVPMTWCPNSGCFFGTYALSNDEYAVVRGCISDFVNDNSENYGRSTCEVGVSSNSVYVDGESAPTPLVGWFTCYLEDNCNSQVVDFELVTRVSRWGYYYDGWKPCTLTSNKNQCLSCQEFDGKGTCKKKSKSYCNGAYCTSTTGKFNGRSFENRGCSPTAPLGLQRCNEIKGTNDVDFFGFTLHQSYSAKTCICSGDKCNKKKLGEE